MTSFACSSYQKVRPTTHCSENQAFVMSFVIMSVLITWTPNKYLATVQPNTCVFEMCAESLTFPKKKKIPSCVLALSDLRRDLTQLLREPAEPFCRFLLSKPIRNGGRHMGFSSVRVAVRKHLLQLWSQNSSLQEEASCCTGLCKLKRVPHFCSARRLDSVCLMWKLECVSLVTGSAFS